jgi:regulator of cell morphogenesis and NO signaling
MVEKFFNEYFDEVTEHLDYEEQVAFPSVYKKLGIENIAPQSLDPGYSISVYRTHHTDIEFKLSELKSLLLKHIPTNGDSIERRRLLTSLFELEFDLSIHSLIEESILIPLVKKLETNMFPERHNRRSSES